ncbi:MAG: hypothetical protein ACXWYM_00020 [Candidatus Binatia bacterium]
MKTTNNNKKKIEPMVQVQRGLSTQVIMTRRGFRGFVVCYEDGVKRWSRGSGIERTNREDAAGDARDLRKEILELNGIDDL